MRSWGTGMARKARSAHVAAARDTPAARGKATTRAAAAAEDRPARRGRRSARGSQPVWSGNLRFALVVVPVRIYAAIQAGAQISFHQVHQPSGKRVRYQKVVPGIGPVDTDEIVKGFDLGEGQYVLFEPEEIDNLKVEAKRTLDLVQFVSHDDVDPIWFERPFYVTPDGEIAEQAFGVLRDALRDTKKMGLGQFVMRGREYVAALKPCGNGMLLETLHSADEVREASSFFDDFETGDPDPELLDLARELIGRKTGPFDPERFHDHYTEALRELIDAKVKHRKPVSIEEGEPSGAGKVIDLVEALKRSVASGKRSEPERPAPERASPRRRSA